MYTSDGEFREVVMPHGAILISIVYLSKLLQDKPDELANAHKEIYGNFCDKYRREYYGMHLYEDAQKRSYFAISRYLGCRDGEPGAKVYSLPPQNTDEPVDLLVWDSGLGGLNVNEECRFVLWASDKSLPDREQFDKIASKCYLFIDADVLRMAGAMISRQISWERTVFDLMWQLLNNESISYLMKAKHILIPFAEDGAVYIDNSGMQTDASLILTHGGSEGTLREKTPGYFDNTFICMILWLITEFSDPVDEMQKKVNIRRVLEEGGAVIQNGYKFGEKEYSLMMGSPPGYSGKDWQAFSLPLIYDEASQQVSIDEDWTITDSVGDRRINDLAFDYVLKGMKVIEGLPQLSFGALTTIDRWEIESYQNIRNLIVGYAASEDTRPLSIAVYGSPGSGKSFGVTQIALNVIPGKVERLAFNVSQFTGLADLANAFQKVRDTILGGKLPLVFFDEFDSDRDGIPLGWIKSFLMPMQDGMFKDDSGEHPLGRCILVFAGGTASSFEDFVKEDEMFRNIKGPDFVSRLKGTINVLGPNQINSGDKNFILRRALLLRGLCERKLKFNENIAPVSADIINAMLHVPVYKHGARSMEAIIDMSRIDGNSWEPASLPSHAQLSLHVDADAFIDLVLRRKKSRDIKSHS